MKQVFYLSKGWKVFSLVFIVFFAALAGAMIYLLLLDDSLLVNIISLVIFAFFLLCAIYFAFLLKRYHLALEENIIIIQGAFGSKRIDMRNFNAYRIIYQGHPPRVLLINSDNKKIKAQSVELVMDKREGLLEYVHTNLINLDETDIKENLSDIIQNENLGMTEEDRLNSLKKAIKLNWFLFFLILAAGIGSFFFTRYHDFFITALCATPFVLLVIIPFSKGLIKFNTKIKTAYPSVLAGFIMSILFLLLWATAFFGRIIGWSDMVMPTIVLTLLLSLVYFIANNKEKITKSAVTGMLFFALMYGFCASINLNALGRPELVETHQVRILNKKVSGGRSTTYYFTVTPWGHRDRDNDVEVGRQLYRSLEVDQDVTVLILRGRVNIRYYVVR